jgi:hypothetical protein
MKVFIAVRPLIDALHGHPDRARPAFSKSTILRLMRYPGLNARMSTPRVPYSSALDAEGASEKVS